MQKREFELPIVSCPFCGAKNAFKVRGRIDDIPYFGEVMTTLVSCGNCKLKHADVMCLGERPPIRYVLNLTSENDLMARVVKSSTGTIKLPELGVTIEPGPASEGYISNVEGVLDRIEEALNLARKGAGPAQKRRADARLKKLDRIRAGKLNAKLIVMDPFGYSGIISESAKKRKLTRRELASLKRWAPTQKNPNAA